jgi:hypothetical protein
MMSNKADPREPGLALASEDGLDLCLVFMITLVSDCSRRVGDPRRSATLAAAHAPGKVSH